MNASLDVTEIPASLIGARFDAALSRFFPQLSLRGRRRLIADGRALIDGSPARPGRKLKKGDKIAILPPSSFRAPEPVFLGKKGNFYIFDKPAGLHTQELAGRAGASLEAWVRDWAKARDPEIAPPRLLQRLDFRTSGIVVGADEVSCAIFRRMENEGLCRKRYLTILEGELVAPATVSRALDTDNRRTTRVLAAPVAPLRGTRFEPLGSFAREGKIYTATVCEIRKGLRHQIRAHAASIGHPLAGDDKYGVASEETFYLRHVCLETPEFKIFRYPGDLPEKDMEKLFLKFAEDNNLQARGARL